MNEHFDGEAVAELFRDSSSPSLCMKGQEFTRTGSLEVALMYFMRALDLDPDYALAWCDYGHCLYQLERFEEAASALRKATELDTNVLLPWALLGLSHLALNYFGDARRCLKACRSLGPDDSRTEFLALKLSERRKQTRQWWHLWN